MSSGPADLATPTWEHQGRRVEHVLDVDVPPDVAWAAWADPEGIARWFVDWAAGPAVPGTNVTWRWEDFDLDLQIPVLAARPGELLVLEQPEFQYPGVLEVLFAERAGGTRVTLYHSGFPAETAGEVDWF